MKKFSLNKEVLRLSVPSIFANITLPLVGMIDMVLAGKIGTTTCIGAVAIATMLFDMLYWNMSFLRLGTSGLVAQAFGRKDQRAAMMAFLRGISTSTLIAMLIWAIQYVFVDCVLYFTNTSPEVERLARSYYFIRIWAAPATLGLYVFKGFFIGMQNATASMIVDLVVNIGNIVLSLVCVAVYLMGFDGIAMGTLLAQYLGLIVAIAIMLIKYRKMFSCLGGKSFKLLAKEVLDRSEIIKFCSLNSNLFIRSLGMLCIYCGFTGLSANYGDTMLAVNAIILKILMLYSFFLDGFAYAGEALTGRFIGAGDSLNLKGTVKIVFRWCWGICIVSAIIYFLWMENLVAFFTDNRSVIATAMHYKAWLIILPVTSCVAFTWDGIYIGATASKPMRNSVILSVIGFFIFYYCMKGTMGVSAIWGAYLLHVIIRGIYLTAVRRKYIVLPQD